MKENKPNNLNETSSAQKVQSEALFKEESKKEPHSSESESKKKELFKNFTEGKKKKKNFLDEYI